MSQPVRLNLALLLLAILVTATFVPMSPGLAVAQTIPSASELQNVFTPPRRELRQPLIRAQRALEEKLYDDVAEYLGRVLIPDESSDLYEDALQDYFIVRAGETGMPISLKAEAHRILREMPVKVRNAFESRYGADGRSLLQDAVSQRDIQKLTEVMRMYFFTKAGYEATLLLGRYHLDHGQPLAGALCLKRLADSPDAANYDPELSVLLATCWLYSGQPDKAESTLIAMRDRKGKSPFLAGSDKQLFGENDDPLEWLTRIIGNRTEVAATHSTNWTVFRGGPTRNEKSDGGLPLKSLIWSVITTPSPEDTELIEKQRKKYLDDNVPALPAAQPLAVGNIILMRSPDRLLGVDFGAGFKGGKRVWVYPWEEEEYKPKLPAGLNANQPREQELATRMWEDTVHGQMSSADGAVFLIDELGYTQKNQYNVFPGGMIRRNTDHPESFNKLVALSLARQGALLWKVGGGPDDGENDEPKLSEAFFLGAPLPIMGQLFALAEIKGEIRLVVLDSKTGALQWAQQIAQVELNPILADRRRRLAGATPSFADGVVVCPTSTGAVVAVDIATRSLLWGFQYQQEGRTISRGFSRIRTNTVQAIGQRWADSSVTIADGRVIVTPVESKEMFCLDLLTGKKLWAKPRGENLYVACHHDLQVVLVGKNAVTALKATDGEEAWKLNLEDGAMPSGRGFYSENLYYLPTTNAEVVKIELESGTIVGRVETRYRDSLVLGNLICHQGAIISHGVDRVSKFSQRRSLREEVARELEKNPNKPEALTSYGELLLQDGKQAEALDVIRRAHKLDPTNDTTRELLVNTLLAAMREDFAASESIASELEELINQPAQRTEYLRLRAAGLITLKKLNEAFAALVEMSSLSENAIDDKRLEQIEPRVRMRQNRWILARLESLYDEASSDQRDTIDLRISDHLDTAVKSGDVKSLRQFLRLFDFHSKADRARLALAQTTLDKGAILDSELLLIRCVKSKDQSIQATAAAIYADLLEKSGRIEEAAAQYRVLASKWGDVVVHDKKTGSQMLQEASKKPTFNAYLPNKKTWLSGKSSVKIATDSNLSTSFTRRVSPVPIKEVRGQLLPGTRVLVDQSNLLVRDGLGNELFRVPVPPTSGARYSTSIASFMSARINGQILVVSLGSEIVAIDMGHARRAPSDAVLWRRQVVRSATTTYQQLFSPRSVKNPWGETRYEARDSSQNLVGAIGTLSDRGFCFIEGRELICVDPISGEVIWQRDSIQPGSDLFGDDQRVFVVAKGKTEADVYDLTDGRLLGQRGVAGNSYRWTTSGARVLSWSEGNGKQTLALNDVWTEKELWSRSFPSGTKGCLVEHDEVAVMQPDGRFSVMSLDEGGVVFESPLESETSLLNIYVQRSSDQYFLTTNTSYTRRGASPIQLASHAPVIHGHVYAFDRRTGKLQWRDVVKVDRYCYPLDQPTEQPVLMFYRQVTRAGNSSSPTSSLLCLDRRTGRPIFPAKDEPNQTRINVYDMHANRTNQTVAIRLRNKSYTIRFSGETP